MRLPLIHLKMAVIFKPFKTKKKKNHEQETEKDTDTESLNMKKIYKETDTTE